MPWRTSNLEQQREQFVTLAASKSECISSLCVAFGVSRPTGYYWLKRAQESRTDKFANLSRRPHRLPGRISRKTEKRILEIRDDSGLGPKKIAELLRSEGHKVGRTTAHRILQENGRGSPKCADGVGWIASLLSATNPLTLLKTDCPRIPELSDLAEVLRKGTRYERRKAVAVLARYRRSPIREVADTLQCCPRTVSRYEKLFTTSGFAALFPVRRPRVVDTEEESRLLFSILHTPPSVYSINRTSWKMTDLHRVLLDKGHRISEKRLHRLIKRAGFRWRKAKVVLTSTDPHYVEKLSAIQTILSELKSDEAFFSIDEYGPFAVKKKGGRKRTVAGEKYTIPQWQKSKGWTIVTAALELSANRVTHFFSLRKETQEMIRMAELLREKYDGYRTLYLSWDAASWHISKKLLSHLAMLNVNASRDSRPVIKTAPLPACAQFLNVIESIFSGMARAIIHNSDYSSLEAAKAAIDKYFEDRNSYFAAHPKRAGSKIWGQERVPCKFSEGQNCKDPDWR